MASILSVVLFTPWFLAHYLFDIILCLFPPLRPAPEWSLNQAVRVRTVRLILLYWSLLLAGDKLTLKPGRERNRFEVIQPRLPKLYQGPLNDVIIRPETTGATWTPTRPPPAAILNAKITVALHFHGGAFVIGDGRDHDTGYLARTLVKHLGCTHVCTPQYRLSSHKDGQFPAALQDALTVYLHLVKELRIPPAQIILSGDSAGGNMVLGLLRYINEYGQELDIPPPAAVALWSPWTDVSAAVNMALDIKVSPNYRTDYLSAEFARWGARTITNFGTIDASSPYLSPLHHPFGLNTTIPIFVNVGEREVLCDDVREFSKRFEKYGWPVHLFVSKGCPHDILLLGPTMGFAKEAEEAADKAKAFLSSSTMLHLQSFIHHMATKLSSSDSTSATAPDSLDFDVVIVGAGISGINGAYRVQTQGPPGMKYVILESRDSIGGTWDLFHYPGIRSDSDIFTFGLPWSPWGTTESMASGDRIKDYLIRSAQSAGIDQHICYRHKVEAADWQSARQCWELKVSVPGKDKPAIFRSRFLLLGTGYYDYETPLETVIPGIENFKGKVIHPQFWPEDYDYTGKDVVIIGSGATAVTILPTITDKAKHATMLQRSPGYVFSLPTSSFFTRLLFAILPATMAHTFNRLLWAFKSTLTTMFCKTFPELAKKFIRRETVRQLPPDIKWDPHFKPRYNPWDQRFCACMNGDFFAALRSGKASVVTDKIKTVTANSIELESGAALHPDVIVTATGLKLKFGGGIQFSLDGENFNVSDKFAWKAAMLQDVPNLLFMTGYEDASWTLGAEVSVQLFLRLLRVMEQKKANVVVPKASAPAMDEKPMMSLSSTYVTTAGKVFPKGGTGHWGPKTNYFADMLGAKWGNVTQDLVFM
ncbi:FAD/NAD(P)-binding domain-containing protein [Xylariaceae sp. AK1471]|nr:FAD/NAD(P)-binding domain-containing protein [Xylariaceae sp. AK1471]